MSSRLGFPTYANPSELKSDLRVLLDRLDQLEAVKDAAEQIRYLGFSVHPDSIAAERLTAALGAERTD